ncbi:MAG: DUF349 domain-containing protein [Wenzhouxiangella sp.]
MNFTARFFKKPWQDKRADVRAKAVASSDEPDLVEQLASFAQNDEAAEVRLAALRRLNSPARWLAAREKDKDPAIQNAADLILLKASLKAGSDNAGERAGQQWLAHFANEAQRRQVAMKAADPAMRRVALQGITAQGFLGDCYAAEKDKTLAAELLARIDQPSTLERLAESVRKSSKAKAQAVAARLADLNAEAGGSDPDHAEAERLVVEIEKLSRDGGQGGLAQGLAALVERWQAVRSPDPALERRFLGARRIVESALARPAAAADASDEADDQPDTAASAAAEPELNPALADAAQAIQAAIRQKKGQPPLRDLLGNWDRAWNALGQPGQAENDLKDRMLPLLKEIQHQLEFQQQAAQKSTDKDGKKPSGDQGDQGGKPAPSGPSAEAITAMLDELSASLEAGDLVKASKQLSKAQQALKSARGKGSAAARLNRLEGRFREIKDYQHWSNNQHREDLIERVEALAGSGQHPDAISAALQDARKEWQRLESQEKLPGDKRRFVAPSGQWRRFQKACQSAFDDAKPFFEKRSQVQKDHLGALKAFIEQSNGLAADEATKTPALLEAQRTARQAIRRLDELPPGERGAAASKLRDLMNTLSKAIDQRFGAVAEKKRALIAEAEALADEADLKTAIDKAKGLQQKWKASGSGKRAEDQKLWKAFRKPIDQLFDQLGEKRQAEKQANQEQIQALEALCEQAEALGKLSAEELESAPGRLQALLDEWNDSPVKPPARLSKRLDTAREVLKQRLAEKDDQARARFRARFDELCLAIQAFAGQPEDAAAKATALIEQSDPADTPLLAHAHERLQAVLTAQGQGQSAMDQAEQRQATARQLVVEMEFVSGQESPAEDSQLRMEYQVARLAERMRGGSQLPEIDEELLGMQMRWVNCLPLPTDDFAGLDPRQQAARLVLERMAGG